VVSRRPPARQSQPVTRSPSHLVTVSSLTWQRVNDEAILTRAAAITFYGMAALVPFMGLVIALLAHGLPWIKRAFAGGVQLEPTIDPLEWLLPVQAASLIEHELNRLRAEPRVGLLSFGLAAMLWLSSSVFVEIIDAMHAIRGVRDSRPFWKRRLIAMVMTLATATILISAMVTIVVWPQILNWLGLSRAASIMATFVHIIVVALTVYITFALAVRVGSNVPKPSRWITSGSLVGTVMMLAASLVLRIYALRWADYGATYGSLAGIMLLMTWLWTSSLAMLVAAVIDKVVEDANQEASEHGDSGRDESGFAFCSTDRAESKSPARWTNQAAIETHSSLYKQMQSIFEAIRHWVCPVSEAWDRAARRFGPGPLSRK
jgi:membrane protein